MSSVLTWRPVEQYQGSLPDSLKFVLRESGKLPGEFSRHVNGDFIEGLIAAKVQGAKELMELIDKHGIIQLQEEY